MGMEHFTTEASRPKTFVISTQTVQSFFENLRLKMDKETGIWNDGTKYTIYVTFGNNESNEKLYCITDGQTNKKAA